LKAAPLAALPRFRLDLTMIRLLLIAIVDNFVLLPGTDKVSVLFSLHGAPEEGPAAVAGGHSAVVHVARGFPEDAHHAEGGRGL
jgi:hypothetical protein